MEESYKIISFTSTHYETYLKCTDGDMDYDEYLNYCSTTGVTDIYKSCIL
jgi:hypothetical protein